MSRKAGMVNDSCSCLQGCTKFAVIASRIIPIGYETVKAILIQER